MCKRKVETLDFLFFRVDGQGAPNFRSFPNYQPPKRIRRRTLASKVECSSGRSTVDLHLPSWIIDSALDIIRVICSLL